MRDTSIELVSEGGATDAGWGALSQDWTFEFEIYDNRTHGIHDADHDEHWYKFYFVIAPSDRDLYDRYRPKEKDWQAHQRLRPIWSLRDKTSTVIVDVYSENPWRKQSLKRNPRRKWSAATSCHHQVEWWMAMRDFAKWLKNQVPVDFISTWELSGTGTTDPSSFFRAGEFLVPPPATSPGTTSGPKKKTWEGWALHRPPSAYFFRMRKQHKYRDPLWNTPNGWLWVYDHDPWHFIAA
jgi:hypothetical protein